MTLCVAGRLGPKFRILRLVWFYFWQQQNKQELRTRNIKPRVSPDWTLASHYPDKEPEPWPLCANTYFAPIFGRREIGEDKHNWIWWCTFCVLCWQYIFREESSSPWFFNPNFLSYKPHESKSWVNLESWNPGKKEYPNPSKLIM